MTILASTSNTDDHAMTAGKKTDTTPLPFQIPEGTPFSTDIDHALRKGFRHFFCRQYQPASQTTTSSARPCNPFPSTCCKATDCEISSVT